MRCSQPLCWQPIIAVSDDVCWCRARHRVRITLAVFLRGPKEAAHAMTLAARQAASAFSEFGRILGITLPREIEKLP